MPNKPVEKVMLENERYKRQELLWGSDGQAKLGSARVAVVGMDHQGAYAALCMASLGIGNLVLIDGEGIKKGQRFLGETLQPGPRAAAYAAIIRKVNPQVKIETYQTDLESKIDQCTLTGANVIVDATNSQRSKSLAITYAREFKIPVLSTSSKYGYTKTMLCKPENDDPAYLMPMFEGKKQDELMALVMCGVVTEEVRKLVFNEVENFLKSPVRYRLGNGYRFGFLEENEEVPQFDKDLMKNMKIALFGGGALTNWGAIAASLLGFGVVDIYDYDTFEPHNINRQVLGYDGIGNAKATHIAKKIKAMTKGQTQSTGYNMLLTPGFKTEKQYDLVFDMVDNSYTRAVNTAYALTNDVPMISAGALPFAARSITQVNGKTTCFACIYDIFKKGMEEEMIKRASCVSNPNASVVMSNAIGATMAVIESLTVLSPEVFGEPVNGEMMYRATGARRFGFNPLKKVCDCYSKPVPKLEISEEDVKQFLKENPGALLR